MELNFNLEEENNYMAAGITRERFSEIYEKFTEELKENSEDTGDGETLSISNIALVQSLGRACNTVEELAVMLVHFLPDFLNQEEVHE